MRKVLVLCSLAAILSISGCKGHSIVGNWTTQNEQGPATVTFEDGGKAKAVFDSPQGHASIDGTYTLEKDQLTFTGTSLDVKATDPKQQAEWDAIKGSVTPQLLQMATTVYSGKVEWKSNDEFTTNGTKTFTRVKA